MSLIKDLTKVKDEEITLQDVKRAEEIIARANKLLGRSTPSCQHHYHWDYVWPYVVPNLFGLCKADNVSTLNSTNGTTGGRIMSGQIAASTGSTLSARSSIVDAAKAIA